MGAEAVTNARLFADDPPASGETVAVYPLVPTRALDDPLTYLVPDSCEQDPVVGTLVEIPLGNARRIGVVADVGVPVPEGVSAKPFHRVVQELSVVPPHMVRLAEWVADTYGCARTRALALVVPPRIAAHARASELHRRRSVQAVRRLADVEPDPDGPKLSSRLIAVLDNLPAEWMSVADATREFKTTRASLANLAAVGCVELADLSAEEWEQIRDSEGPDPKHANQAEQAHTLTEEQVRAYEMCISAPDDDPATLLAGATGTGKTEIYLQAIERFLESGKSAVVLVPEIALTPQTARRFLRRFPGNVEVLHSNLTRTQRARAHDRIARGDSRVVVGPRSAIFAPLTDLGVVVIDEEHDGSYKQDSEPRYDARRVAYRLAQLTGARLIFGSATPRLESWHGIRRHATLEHRAAGGRLATVELVDLREWGNRFPLTDPLRAALDATLRRGRKAVLLHNRRGYATAVHCTDCGNVIRCPNCDVTLVVHGPTFSAQHLDCHHCGIHEQIPSNCPSCNGADLGRLGAGTERLEIELAEAFDVPIHRLDADAVRTAGAVEHVLTAFGEPGPAVLVGTQMVAKGHDFPDVELAAVVDADTALAIPDFRAEERAFSLVTQLAGRAGRSAHTAEHARVLVQSWNTDAAFLKYASTHDVAGFLAAELERRRELDYPPFTRLVRVLVSSTNPEVSWDWASTVAEGLVKLEAGKVIGPAPLLRISGRYRAQAAIKTHHAGAVATAMRAFLRSTSAGRSRRDIRIALDVDPQTMV
jgi:primosomal protein N' (replication factor Y)